jgi:hypothetical protein
MTFFSRSARQRLFTKRSTSLLMRHPMYMMYIWMMVMTSACTHLGTTPLPGDPAAEQIIETIQQTNIDLVQFKCVGKITVSGPGQPVQSYRSAIAGQLNNHLRIDLFAPFGGAAGSVASDGEHLFLVLHGSRDYYKKRFGNGSLHRFVKIDITVGDLLELLVGRIPIADERSARSVPVDDTEHHGVYLVDRWGKTRQKITLNTDGRPLRSKWFDKHDKQILALEISGRQTIDGFVLPKRVNLNAASGQTISIRIERYETNAVLDETLFVLPPISS